MCVRRCVLFHTYSTIYTCSSSFVQWNLEGQPYRTKQMCASSFQFLVTGTSNRAMYVFQVFPDKEHFGRIFYNMAQMSALGIPQVAIVHGISVAGSKI